MNNASAALRAAAANIVAQADLIDIGVTHDIDTTNIYSGNVVQLPAPVPQEFYFFSTTNPYGAHPSIGSPNNQAALRAYAARDGFADLNHYVKTPLQDGRVLTPIWPDTKLEPSPGYIGDVM
jgi:hypothetical protein